MVVIRLARGGQKDRPFYHIVAADSRTSRDGRYLERLGFFNPLARGNEQRLRLDLGRAEYWMSVGAQPSARVRRLIKDLKKEAASAETEAAA